MFKVSTTLKPIHVRLFFRRARPSGNVSIENSFLEMHDAFPKNSRFQIDRFYSNFFSNGFLPRLKAVLEVRKNRQDINHITGDTNFLGLALSPRKTIVTIHDCGLLDGKNWLARQILWLFWLKLPVMRSRFVTAVSEATKREVIKLTGCSAEKIVVIPTVIKSIFSYQPKVFNKNYPTILHVGTSPNKNLERHAEALFGLPCQLHVIGEMSENQVLALTKYKIDYKNSVNLTNEQVHAAYVEADFLLFCSTVEGFGMPIIEAQTVGRAVITSNISAMPEVAGDSASLADPLSIESIKSQILRVIHDDNYRDGLISRGFENIQRFNPKTVANQYEQLYQRLV